MRRLILELGNLGVKIIKSWLSCFGALFFIAVFGDTDVGYRS